MARLLKCRTYVAYVGGEDRNTGGMTWPAATGEVADLGYALRYAPDSLTRGQQLTLASIVDAYLQMVGDPAAKRNMVCRQIREASAAPMSLERTER